MSVRLLVVDYQPQERNLLERRLAREPGFEVVAQWLKHSDVERMVEQHDPDVLLLDLDLPDHRGFKTLQRLAALPRARVLATCAHIDDEIVLRVFDLGGYGVVAKQSPHEMLVRSIRTVADRRYWAPPEHVAVLIETLRTRQRASQPARGAEAVNDAKRFRLTRRELDIVAGVAVGASNKEIATRLSVAECTVKHHLTSVYTKVGVFSRLQLAVFAIHHHLVQAADMTQYLP